MAITVQDPNKDKEVQPEQTSSRPGPPNAQQQGSGYTNIQQITKANQGNRLNQVVGGGVQQVGQQAQDAIGQSKSDFNQAVQSSNPYLNDTNQTQQKVQSIVADPTANADAEAGNFAQYRSGQYGGPQQLANYDAIQQQAQAAQQLGQNIGTTGGRTALLQRFAANPTQSYSTGQSRLDSALLAQGPQKQLQEAQRDTRGLTGQVDTANQAAGAQAQDYQARAKALADYTNLQVQGAENPALEDLSTKVTATNDDVNKVLSDFKAGTATPEELNRLGLGNLVGQNSLGLDLTGYLGATNPSGASRLGVADSATAAKLAALSKLGGQTDLGNEFTESDTNKAGSALTNQFAGADKALAAYQAPAQAYAQNKSNYDDLNSISSKTISNDIANSNSAQQAKDLLTPELIHEYVVGDPDTQKRIRETALSDSAINNKYGSVLHIGTVRDQLSGLLDQEAAKYNGAKQALSKYSGGYTYGGSNTPQQKPVAPGNPAGVRR